MTYTCTPATLSKSSAQDRSTPSILVPVDPARMRSRHAPIAHLSATVLQRGLDNSLAMRAITARCISALFY